MIIAIGIPPVCTGKQVVINKNRFIMTVCTRHFNNYNFFIFNGKGINLTIKKQVVAHFLFIINLVPERLDNLATLFNARNIKLFRFLIFRYAKQNDPSIRITKSGITFPYGCRNLCFGSLRFQPKTFSLTNQL